MRVQGLREHGAAGFTIQRVRADGDLSRIGRRLHQNPEAKIDNDLTLAEITKRIPKGVTAMTLTITWPWPDPPDTGQNLGRTGHPLEAIHMSESCALSTSRRSN